MPDPRDTVLLFFPLSLFWNDFHGDQKQSESVLARSHDVRNQSHQFNRVCRAIRRGRFARWLNDLGTAHRSLRFLIINLNVPNSILLRVFSRFPFWLFVRDHRDHSRLFIFETGNIYFFHKRFHTRLLNKMFFFQCIFI